MGIDLRHGDCLDVMAGLDDASIDSIVTDPPYELGFMGRKWDASGVAFDPRTWAAALRVLKPGGHLVAFGAPKNYHRLACAIEDAGFEIRDSLMWVTGQGFPKSHNVSMNLDDNRCRCENGTKTLSECDLRLVRDADVPAAEHDETQRREVLQHGVPQQGAQGDWPTEVVAGDARREQPCLEGRGDLPEAPGQLRQREIRPLPAGVPADGAGGRLCDGPSAGDGEVDRPPASSGRVRSSQEPSASGERPSEPRTVAGQPEPQAGGAWPLCGRCGKPIIPDGLGTALKPAYEPIVLARKPLIGTVAETVLAHGTGALNIDACRVGTEGGTKGCDAGPSNGILGDGLNGSFGKPVPGLGRWPANLVHDGSEEVLAAFPNAGGGYGKRGAGGQHGIYSPIGGTMQEVGYGDSGSAARFFYCAKASKTDRAGSKHPTVKPIALMRWLVRLITPPGGIVLDPFAGSGTTGEAARLEGFNVTLIEREDEYMADIKRRLNA